MSILESHAKQSPDPRPVPDFPLFWRIVFTQQLFVIQITNNFGGPKLAWITVSTGEEVEYRIPENYLTALQLGSPSMFLQREVVERRAVPATFSSYGAAREHALTTMNLPPKQEWHPNSVPAGLSWWRRLLRLHPKN